VKRRSAALLCLAAGATDVLSYMTLGKIFTSAMTGCAALFFVKSSGGDFATATRALLALASYFLGCGIGTMLQPRDPSQMKSPATLRRLLLAECLFLTAYVGLALAGSHPAAGADRYVLIFLSACAMGIQSIIALDLSEPGVSTVVLNPTMTSLGVALTKRLAGREPALPGPNRVQIAVLAAYAVGAVLTAFAVRANIHAANALPLLAVAGVLVMFHQHCRSVSNS
jgi:uncharacterized membrane protein YoaK (UPF0700 family)